MPAIFSCPDDGGPPLAAAPIPKLIEIELGIELLGEPRLDSLVQFARRKGRAGASQEVIGQTHSCSPSSPRTALWRSHELAPTTPRGSRLASFSVAR